MNEYLSITLAALVVCSCWYGYRWGHADGKAEGYLSGNAVNRADSHAVNKGNL